MSEEEGDKPKRCPHCGSKNVLIEFGEDVMHNLYYWDVYCSPCDSSYRIYRKPKFVGKAVNAPEKEKKRVQKS